MRKDLEEIKPFWQSQADKEMKLQRQIHVCQLVIDMFENNDKDIEGRRRCINAGIPTALAQLYEKQDDIFIKQQHIDAFFYIGVYEVNIIGQLLFSKYLFGGLLRILQHPDNSITFRGIQCIFNIIVAGSNINLSPQVLHPYFDSIGGHSGIKRLYEFFNKWNQYECSKNTASICIGNLCRARMIEDETIRKNIIAHLKKIINDTDKWTRDSSRFALQYLASNSVNKAEITKDGFAVPK
ncbi:MAG: hypothetical protein EZS28_014349 [Streblomastix strix]|uniref:Uncharacterized protein n=1 Tax=Streblomastix strix TaxID=222440 RepID=A0A5J4W6J6_9EUKA|nr:MAG: hypothetical protein EZS28_014349 [Streblomastix strix]